MTPPILELNAVQTHIGAYHILHGVDLQVPAGQVTMLLGRNGAGKTTTLRTIMGLWPASGGELRFQGHSIKGLATPDIAAKGIAYVPEAMGIFTDLTVQENMVLAARAARHAGELDRQRLDWIFSLFPALQKFWLHPAGKLSGGQKQMLAVARAIVEPRALILIDEPSKGLAPAIVQNLIELHGGAFELHSELRKGTEAIVIFPKKRVLAAVPPLQPLGHERHRGGQPEATSRPARLRGPSQRVAAG